MRWRRVAVGKTAATWRNEHGAVITMLKMSGGETGFHYTCEGKGYAHGKITFIEPDQIPFVEEVKTTKIREGGIKFLRIQFRLNDVSYIVETELLKKP